MKDKERISKLEERMYRLENPLQFKSGDIVKIIFDYDVSNNRIYKYINNGIVRIFNCWYDEYNHQSISFYFPHKDIGVCELIIGHLNNNVIITPATQKQLNVYEETVLL